MTIPAAVSLATLGVADVGESTRFYTELGFELSPASVAGEVSFFRAAGGILAVWSAEALRQDAGIEQPLVTHQFRGVALAINVVDRATVDSSMTHAEASGARIVKPATATPWGGYQGYFTDPDGHLWEIAHNPDWPIGDDGRPQLP
ncbi:MAG: VOC family protein [Actinomycetota bacterium]|nr:VOC family protein [Actinomycetota bacterium]